MKRSTARIALVGVASLVLLVILCVVILVAVVDPNDFKPKIEEAVLAATGKTLALQGDLSLVVFPALRLEAGPAELRNDADSASPPFARVEKVSASVELLPLFSSRMEVKSLTVSGLRLNLAVDAKGNPNWTMPEKTPAQPQPASPAPSGTAQPKGEGLGAIALDSLAVNDLVIRYTDERTKSDQEFTISKMDLDSLRVGEKTTLRLAAAYAGDTAKPIALAMTAEFTLPSSFAQGVIFNASGKMDETTFTCKGAASLPQTPGKQFFSFKGDLGIGVLNVDAYTAFRSKVKQGTGQTAPGRAQDALQAGGSRIEMLVRNLLHSLFLDVHLTAQSVTVAKVPLSAINATVKADRGQLTIKPATLNAAGAAMSFEASVDAREETVRSRLTGEWRKADVGALLRASTGKASLTGALDLAWVINMADLDWPTAVKTLSGNVTAGLENGTVPGFKLIPAGIPGLPSKTLELTNVRGGGTWNITHGIAQNNDLSLKAAGLAASGKGRIDIPAQTCHYNISVDVPTIAELPDLTVLPVVVSGPLASPSYAIDQPALLRDTAKNLLNPATKTGQELQKAGERLGKILSR